MGTRDDVLGREVQIVNSEIIDEMRDVIQMVGASRSMETIKSLRGVTGLVAALHPPMAIP